MAATDPTRDKARLDEDFSELYKAHLRDVYSYSYYRVGNHHDAEDLTEQTFLQAYRHFERAQRESEGRPLRPWLIRIAHNLAANYYRDRSRRPQTADRRRGRALRAAHDRGAGRGPRRPRRGSSSGVQELPDDRREALIMRFALGMDNREIARALGRTDGATKVLLHRAIRQLEELVQGRGADGDRRDAMSERAIDIETMLRQALAPVEPPAELEARLETTLGSLVELAADELESWELAAMQRPANWPRAALARPPPRSSARPPPSAWSCSAPSASATTPARPVAAARSTSPRARCATAAREARSVLDDLHADPRRSDRA